MAAAADNPRRKRGRPRAFSPETLAKITTGAYGYPVGRTALHDFAYKIRAWQVLEKARAMRPVENDPLDWLYPPGDNTGVGRTWKHGLLAQLGRIRDERLLLEAALSLCRDKPPTREGIVWLRRVRQAGRLPS